MCLYKLKKVSKPFSLEGLPNKAPIIKADIVKIMVGYYGMCPKNINFKKVIAAVYDLNDILKTSLE